MKTLLVLGIRLLLIAVFAFLFIVLYERGFSGFLKGIPEEFAALAAEAGISLDKKPSPPPQAGPYREPDLPDPEDSKNQEPAPIAPDLSTPEEADSTGSGS